jgi:hypothetical protein
LREAATYEFATAVVEMAEELKTWQEPIANGLAERIQKLEAQLATVTQSRKDDLETANILIIKLRAQLATARKLIERFLEETVCNDPGTCVNTLHREADQFLKETEGR